jgi:hypothetical protein
MGVGGETRSRNLSMLSLLSYIYTWMWDYVSDHVSGRLDLLGHLPTRLVLDFDPPTPLIVKPWWGIDEELKVAGVRHAQIEE